MQLSSPVCFSLIVSSVTPSVPTTSLVDFSSPRMTCLFALKAHSWQSCCRQMHMPGCPRFIRLFRGNDTYNCNSCINRKYSKPLLFKTRGEPTLCPKVWFLKMCVTIKMLFLVFESLCVCAQGHARCPRASISPQTHRENESHDSWLACVMETQWGVGMWSGHDCGPSTALTHTQFVRTLLCDLTVFPQSHVLISSEKITVMLYNYEQRAKPEGQLPELVLSSISFVPWSLGWWSCCLGSYPTSVTSDSAALHWFLAWRKNIWEKVSDPHVSIMIGRLTPQ